MTTFDPDSLVQHPNVLREIVDRFGGVLALNCDVVLGGDVHVNQEVRFVRHSGRPAHQRRVAEP